MIKNNVWDSQKQKYNINPAAGYFGPTTRTLINSTFNDGASAPVQVRTSGEVIILEPGWLIKNKKFAEVFYVESDLSLRWVINEDVAIKHFGQDWNKDIKEFDDLGALGLRFGSNFK